MHSLRPSLETVTTAQAGGHRRSKSYVDFRSSASAEDKLRGNDVHIY